MIHGGYYIKARKIEDSEISFAPPHVREIWDYLLRNANHKPGKSSGRIIERGQLYTTYEEIIEALSWRIGYRKETYKKSQCETAMKTLRKTAMITTARTTRGMIITICNYDYYQNPKNYDNRTDNPSDNPSETVREPPDKQEQKKKEERINTYARIFGEFWDIYPRKSGKEKARKAFLKVKKPREVLNKIKLALEWQKQSDDWNRDNGQYIPYPSTYINQHRWEDEPTNGNNRNGEQRSNKFLEYLEQKDNIGDDRHILPPSDEVSR